ncbi:hypothetical protein [Luteipulveratus halotolerans]|uniref:Uncharacterized protein n=1 Tax=Luteipulveratus halotolerans TaxID=1631356 RepID=A0A0L6CEP9_9MICO|nr:hypothetical protein [Luteipulveratus halotolerans]KNX36164.1 hypothetical protein VV01_01775 [Luteipulveratus halotolerans]
MTTPSAAPEALSRLSLRDLIIQLRDLEDQLMRAVPLPDPTDHEQHRVLLQRREMMIVRELRRRRTSSPL